MELDITKHGDALEREYAVFITTRLQAYDLIWKKYIGNDGTANLIAVSALDQDENRERQLFAQHHYSCLESIICMKLIVEESEARIINDITDYIHINNDFLAFQAHAGRINDCLRKCGDHFDKGNVSKDLEEYYKQRNTVLHGCKLPFLIVYGVLAIPTPKGVEEDRSRWNDKKSWKDAEQDDFDFMSSYMKETFDGIVKELNKALYNILDRVKEYAIEKKFTLEVANSAYMTTVSGIQDNHAIPENFLVPLSGSTPTIKG